MISHFLASGDDDDKDIDDFECLVGCSTSLSATRLSRGWFPRLTPDIFTCCCDTETERGDHAFAAGHIIPTLTQPHGAGARGGNRAHDLLTRSRSLYRLSYRRDNYHGSRGVSNYCGKLEQMTKSE